MDDFNALLTRVRDCTNCAVDLPLGLRPIVRGTPDAKLLLIGQAPGTRVHESSVPWNEPSVDRLRDWLQMTPDDFYDESKIAIAPMGFCYPGANAKGGDKPPRPNAHLNGTRPVLAGLPNVELTILIGQYAQKRYLEKRRTRGSPWKSYRCYGSELPGYSADAAASNASISASEKPKWWPISWITTWRTIRSNGSPVSRQ